MSPSCKTFYTWSRDQTSPGHRTYYLPFSLRYTTCSFSEDILHPLDSGAARVPGLLHLYHNHLSQLSLSSASTASITFTPFLSHIFFTSFTPLFCDSPLCINYLHLCVLSLSLPFSDLYISLDWYHHQVLSIQSIIFFTIAFFPLHVFHVQGTLLYFFYTDW